MAKERDRFRFRKTEGREARADRKHRQTERRVADGRANGLVEIPGPIAEDIRDEIVRTARNVENRETKRRKGARILSIAPWSEGGLVIETEEEKLAQIIGDAIAESRQASTERFYDDEGMRRVVVCRLPMHKRRGDEPANR